MGGSDAPAARRPLGSFGVERAGAGPRAIALYGGTSDAWRRVSAA
jgi:hypothetical protein